MHQRDLRLDARLQKLMAREIWAIVTANRQPFSRSVMITSNARVTRVHSQGKSVRQLCKFLGVQKERHKIARAGNTVS